MHHGNHTNDKIRRLSRPTGSRPTSPETVRVGSRDAPNDGSRRRRLSHYRTQRQRAAVEQTATPPWPSKCPTGGDLVMCEHRKHTFNSIRSHRFYNARSFDIENTLVKPHAFVAPVEKSTRICGDKFTYIIIACRINLCDRYDDHLNTEYLFSLVSFFFVFLSSKLRIHYASRWKTGCNE